MKVSQEDQKKMFEQHLQMQCMYELNCRKNSRTEDWIKEVSIAIEKESRITYVVYSKIIQKQSRRYKRVYK